MNISSEPTINLHLILTGDEARAFLADARPLQSLVRDELAKQHRVKGRARQSVAAFTCDECGKTFLTEGRYRNHLRDVHQQEAFPNFAHAAESDSQ